MKLKQKVILACLALVVISLYYLVTMNIVNSTTEVKERHPPSKTSREKSVDVVLPKSDSQKNFGQNMSASSLPVDSPRTHSPPKIPMVIVLTYQRCGSSFVGHLFGRNRNAFYVYEPLDSVYTAMYGTMEGWNVPSDITNYPNGSRRHQPWDEVEAVADFQENLLTCQMDKLPVEFLIHKYWRIFNNYQGSLKTYRNCLLKRHTSNQCLTGLNGTCPLRFGQDAAKQRTCGNALWLARSWNVTEADIPPSLPYYRQCASREFDKVKRNCLQHLVDHCHHASLRAIKTVRGTIRSVVPLLEKYPELKIIHLIRDPRSVAMSRTKLHSSMGLYSGNDLTLESRLYCDTVLADYELLQRLPKRLQERFMRVIYEQFVTEPERFAEEIYAFIGADLPRSTRQFFVHNTVQSATKAWSDKLLYGTVFAINWHCSEFFGNFSGIWDQTCTS